jgi:hypothetical protein
MSEIKINLKELALKYSIINGLTIHSNPDIIKKNFDNLLTDLAKQVLELAAENARITEKDSIPEDDYEIIYQTSNQGPDLDYIISKQSILDTIKQIE